MKYTKYRKKNLQSQNIPKFFFNSVLLEYMWKKEQQKIYKKKKFTTDMRRRQIQIYVCTYVSLNWSMDFFCMCKKLKKKIVHFLVNPFRSRRLPAFHFLHCISIFLHFFFICSFLVYYVYSYTTRPIYQPTFYY